MHFWKTVAYSHAVLILFQNFNLSAQAFTYHHHERQNWQRLLKTINVSPTNYLQRPQLVDRAPAVVASSNPKESYIALYGSADDDNLSTTQEDELFDANTTFSLVGAQASLIALSVVVAAAVGTPNFGLGPNIDFGIPSLSQGLLMALPLGVLAYALDFVEENFPALQDVTTATDRSILALLGGTWKPLIGLATATALGIAAGFGEEMLFRGILQYEISARAGDILSVVVTSIIFGALHAVTPLYAFLASLASVYFGYLYLSFDNLAVPIYTHAIYDIGALLYAHWAVSQMTKDEQTALMEWQPPGPGSEIL